VVHLWPKFDRWSLGLQIVRSADSITGNIAEAMGRHHVPDRRRFLVIARGSLYELENWLLLAEDRELIAPGAADELESIAKTLNGLIKRPA
jgi:four helix bundle protein